MIQRNVRTSITDPLKIRWVNTGENGKIGLTFCPGKKDLSIYEYSWDRNLELDLKVIKDSASFLLTLIEDHEFALLKVKDLGIRAKEMGIEWLHLPIQDVSTPGKEFMEDWPKHSLYIRKLLLQKKNVVIHCRGGIGRTGLVAVMLLVDMGMNPGKALDLVRTVRSHAVETPKQEDFCLSYRGSEYM